MKLKAELSLNGNNRYSPLLVLHEGESAEHMALRFAALLAFFDDAPVLDVCANNPFISNVNLIPDLMVSDPVDGILIWIECGDIATSRLIRIARRTRQCRFVVLAAEPKAGVRMRAMLKKYIRDSERIEIFAFPQGSFAAWLEAVLQSENPYVCGEASLKGLNLVLNQTPFVISFIRL